MSKLTMFVNLPEVKDGVICDRSGTLLEHSKVEDAESISAVMGYFANLMGQAGESIGFSDLLKVSLSGPNLSCLIFAEKDALLTLYTDPSSSQQEVEKKIEKMKRSAAANQPGSKK